MLFLGRPERSDGSARLDRATSTSPLASYPFPPCPHDPAPTLSRTCCPRRSCCPRPHTHPPAAPPASCFSHPTSLSCDIHGHQSRGDGEQLPMSPRISPPSLLSHPRALQPPCIWRWGRQCGSDEVGGEGSRSEASLPSFPATSMAIRVGAMAGGFQ